MKTFLAALSVLAALLAPRALALDVHDPAIAGFIDTMAKEHGFSRAHLRKLFRAVEFDPGIVASMQSPAEALPWYKYRAIFLNPARIAAGREFLAANAHILAAAEKRYGVPPEIVAALLGMESYYGRREGSHSALTALSTLAFDYPPRQRFFRKELGDFLLLCRRNHLDPTKLKSSYAGALGAGQFMPSSYLAYAIDADGGGGSDLFTHWPDIIASIAHYLSVNGWRAGQPVASPGGIPSALDPADLLDHTLQAHTLRARGIVFEAPVAATAPVRLVKVATQKGDEYWVGLPNFLALMTYNRSVNYALAATQLAAAINEDAAPATAGDPLAAGHR